MDYSRFIRRRLINLGVNPSDAERCAHWYFQQVTTQGPAGAIRYLKSIGDTILWYLYGSPEKPKWVATQHRFPKSIYFMVKYDEATLARIAKFARAIRLDSVQQYQVDKVVPAVLRPYNGTEDGISLLTAFVKSGIEFADLKPVCEQPQGPQLVGRVFRSVQSVSGPTSQTQEPPLQESLEIIDRVPQLSTLPYWKECFEPIHPDWLEDWFDRGPWTTGSQAVGEIHASQEGGGKLRMYAAPYTVVQCLLRPIHDWIDKSRRKLSTDCTYNQQGGAEWAQGMLIQGQTVYSVDLSTATCRFPLESQLEMLRSLGLQEVFLDALTWACRGTWIVGDELQDTFPSTLEWKVGQPLGIVPSMTAFSLTHNLMLTGICRWHNVKPEDTFRVLGDDVVMVGKEVYDTYCQLISEAGVPISWTKCHTSDRIAEFAGFTITRDFMIRPGQWREAGMANHLSIAEELGTPLKGEVSPLWQKIEQIYLFHIGEYNPPIEEWSEYLRLSSQISELLNYSECPDPIIGKSWYSGFRSLAVQSIKTELDVYFLPPLTERVNAMIKGLPDTLLIREAIKWVKYQDNCIAIVTDVAFFQLFTGIQSSYVTGALNSDEFSLAVERLVENTHGLFWRPPLGKAVRYKLHNTITRLCSL